MLSLKKYFQRWASKRSPRAQQVILRHRTIYILPSKQGLAFLLLALLIWVLGTNYQNNLILAFSFFLVSIMLVSTIHAFKNMLGLTFSMGATQHAVVGDYAPFDVVVRSQYHRAHNALLLSPNDAFLNVDKREYVECHLDAEDKTHCHLHLMAKRRGWLKLPRIQVKSYFPFGLVRAWAYVDLDHKALIFPKPIACEKPPLGVGQGEEGNFSSHQLGDEFQGFQTYQAGSPLSQVAWKQYARGAGLHLKDYRAQKSEHYWLDWQYIQVGDTELGLSYMTYWVHYFSDNNMEFGLILPHTIIDIGVGDIHRVQALTALALFGWVDD